MTRPEGIRLVRRCPDCNREVEIILTKKDVKQIMKGFKLGIRYAQLEVDRYLEHKGGFDK